MIDNTQRDRMFEEPVDQVAAFCFDESVARIFPDMIKRSVPGYRTILGMIGDMARQYVRENTYCYDLGCSLGASTLAMRHGISAEHCRIISVDSSMAMVERCRHIVAADTQATIPVEVQCADVQTIAIEQASMVVLNFTLQFIEPAHRQAILQQIYHGLLPGGVLLLSEKVCFDNRLHQNLMTELHHNFKRCNGYSDLEIAQKRTALEKVLYPDTVATHLQRLNACGFASADLWFQCLNFCSLIAIK